MASLCAFRNPSAHYHRPHLWTATCACLLRSDSSKLNCCMCVLSSVEAGVPTTGLNWVHASQRTDLYTAKNKRQHHKGRQRVHVSHQAEAKDGPGHPHLEWLEQPQKKEQRGNPNDGTGGNPSRGGSEQARAWQAMDSVMVWIFASLQNSMLYS